MSANTYMKTASVFKMNLIARNQSTPHPVFELFFPYRMDCFVCTVKETEFYTGRRFFLQARFRMDASPPSRPTHNFT
jgi:hypothetical protein